MFYHLKLHTYNHIVLLFRLQGGSAGMISCQLGGEEKVEQLHNNAKEAKKIALKSLKNSLSVC